MIELGELDDRSAEFKERGLRVFAASIDGADRTRQNQKRFPALKLVSDEDRGLVTALDALHERAGPGGVDGMYPTTLIVDGAGKIRWVYRPSNVISRLTVDELLAAADEKLGGPVEGS